MKRMLTLLLALTLVLSLAASAAAGPLVLYAAKDDVKVYADKNTSAMVLKTLSKGDSVLIEDSTTGWYATLVEDPDGDGQILGWIQAADLTTVAPCSHNWSEWKITKQPTCTAKGEKTRVCSLCGEKETKPVDMLPHTYGNWIVRREATCTAEGEYYRVCKVCGHEETSVIEKKPHTYGSWVVVREPTCTAKGLKVRRCTVCGYEKTKEIDKLPHNYGEWVVTTEATENSSGVEMRVCQDCGRKQSRSFDPQGTLRRGDKGDAVSEIQQLLVEQGYLDKKKADGSFGSGTEKAITKFQKDQGLTPDGVAWPETIRRLHHDYGDWEVVTPLSRFEDGESVRVCSECGYTQRRTVAAEPRFARGDKDDGLKTVQRMLNDLGYDCGKADGSYGGKLERAWESFALDQGITPTLDQLRPGDLDALTNAWLGARSEETWKGQGDKDSSVNLILTAARAGEEDGLTRFNWTLSNLGNEKCRFVALLFRFDSGSDFRGDDMVVIIDRARLNPSGENRLFGSFTIATELADGAKEVSFCALATEDETGAVWTSNVVTQTMNA